MGGIGSLFLLTLLAMVAGFYLFRPTAPPPPLSESQKTLIRETKKAREAEKEEFNLPSDDSSSEGAVEGPQWIFEGKVYDALRETPIEGAQITFQNEFLRDAKRHSVTSGPFGSYRAEVPSLGQNGYNVRAQRSGYDNRNVWDSSILNKTKRERYRLSQGIQFGPISGLIKGTDGFSVQKDFYVFPINLTEEEKREQSEAFR